MFIVRSGFWHDDMIILVAIAGVLRILVQDTGTTLYW